MNADRIPKIMSVWPILWAKVARWKEVGMNKYFQASRASLTRLFVCTYFSSATRRLQVSLVDGFWRVIA